MDFLKDRARPAANRAAGGSTAKSGIDPKMPAAPGMNATGLEEKLSAYSMNQALHLDCVPANEGMGEFFRQGTIAR
jgi:hypothetical protein